MRKKKDDFDVEISVEGKEKSTAASNDPEDESPRKKKGGALNDLQEDLGKKEELAKEMLRTIDNLEMALDHAREDNQSESITEGIEIILKQLLQSLDRFGVKGFNAVGERFDPTRHEAVMQVESAEHEPDTVVDEAQKGYFLRDRLLRPALVTVSKLPHDEENE